MASELLFRLHQVHVVKTLERMILNFMLVAKP